MGLKISTYSIAELNKISIPGKVVPALFWLLPIGEWRNHDLNNLWEYFTRRSSRCKQVGLMLIKKYDISRNAINNYQDTDLSELTAKLSDLLPSGISTIYNKDILNENHKKNVLLLSGAYPQPGWGILFSFDNFSYDDFENLLKNSINDDILEIFSSAVDLFNIWESTKKNRPKIDDSNLLLSKKNNCIELYNLLNNNLFNTLTTAIKKCPFPEISILFEEFVNKIDNEFILSYLINKLSFRNDQLNLTLKEIISRENAEINSFFKNEEDEDLKQTISLLLKMKSANRPMPEDLISCFTTIFYDRFKIIEVYVENLKQRILLLIGDYEIKIKYYEKYIKEEYSRWKEILEDNRLNFNNSLYKVLNCYLDFSPVFLLNIEKEIRKSGIPCKSISWDPARMVGWKLISENINITKQDLISQVIEIVPESLEKLNYNNIDEKMNGSLFTDYVHYISLNNPNVSPRNATKELLKKTMRTNEIITILKSFGQDNFDNFNSDKLVEDLLLEFGWPVENNYLNNNKFADCIQIVNQNTRINPNLRGNDIRTICENYCKDFIDTLSTKLGYDSDELFDLVGRINRDYQFIRNDWDDMISNLSVGSAIKILKALLHESLPHKKEISDNFISCLDRLRDKLNLFSHDPPEKDTSILKDDIISILQYTEDLISEMPWHFYPVQRNGFQPIILTGNAWSHSYKETRQLSIILWSHENYSDEMLVWNPSKTNPIIPDGIIIKRP